MESDRRIFSRMNLESQLMQWQFKSSEGSMGPYASEAEARAMLGVFITSWKTDGRLGVSFPSSKLAPLLLGDLTQNICHPA